jgi:hypothetical protein
MRHVDGVAGLEVDLQLVDAVGELLGAVVAAVGAGGGGGECGEHGNGRDKTDLPHTRCQNPADRCHALAPRCETVRRFMQGLPDRVNMHGDHRSGHRST